MTKQAITFREEATLRPDGASIDVSFMSVEVADNTVAQAYPVEPGSAVWAIEVYRPTDGTYYIFEECCRRDVPMKLRQLAIRRIAKCAGRQT